MKIIFSPLRLPLFYLFVILSSTLIFSYARAYHPLITDDTGTQGSGRFQYEFQVEYGSDKEDGIKTEEFTLNNTLTYGLTDNIDISIAVPYIYWKEENGQTIDEEGFSDLELGIKYRFYEREGLKIAIKTSITIPSGDEERGLGTGRFTGKAFLIIDREFKDLTLFFNAGYIRNENRIGERENLWHLSVAGEYRLREDFKIAANAGVEENPDSTSDEKPAFLLGGIVYSVTDTFDLSGGIKAGLTEPETDLSLLAGITLRF
ncbi:MAG: transporter [Thermodesulfovibrionales bacterium]|nr:transporter [Thermodesulfovibrionales bacterium]